MPYRHHAFLLFVCCFAALPTLSLAQTDLPPIIMGQPGPSPAEFPFPTPDTLRGLHCSPIVYDFDYYDDDSGVGPVLFSLDPGNPGTIDENGVYTFVPTFGSVGQFLQFTASACRPAGNCTETTVRIIIDNDAPEITNLSGVILTTTAGATEIVPLDIFDSCEDDPLDLFIVSSGGLAIPPSVNDITQQLTIQTTGSDFGLYTIKIGATDTKDTSICAFQLSIPGDNAISLDSVIGLDAGQLVGGSPAELRFRITIDPDINSYLTGYSNAFRVYSPDGATWDTTYQAYLPAWPVGTPDGFDNTALARYGLDGVGDDTLAFAGLVFFSDRGALPGYDSVAWSITISPSQTLINNGRTICIDTAYNFPPSNQWLWNDSTLRSYSPVWDGPYCFTIISEACCAGTTGNVNNDPGDQVTLTDLTLLVNHLFVTFESLPCRPEANTSGDANCALTLTDLTALVNRLFVTFLPTADCSQFDAEACY